VLERQQELEQARQELPELLLEQQSGPQLEPQLQVLEQPVLQRLELQPLGQVSLPLLGLEQQVPRQRHRR
jgi:hypothetical protein